MKRIQTLLLVLAGAVLLAANANAGRWITRDPMDIPQHMERDPHNFDLNLYTFVGNNPVNKIDPLGLEGNPVSSTLPGYSGAWNSNPFGPGGSFYGPGSLWTPQQAPLPPYPSPTYSQPPGTDAWNPYYGIWQENGLQADPLMDTIALMAFGGLTTPGRIVLPSRVGLGTRACRFFYDNRSFRAVSRQYWNANGPANGSSLHHWLFPQSAAWVPQGIRNAGFNLMELPPVVNTPFGGLNQWMGMSSSGWAPVADWSIRLGVPAAMGSAAYGGAQIGSQVSGSTPNQ